MASSATTAAPRVNVILLCLVIARYYIKMV